MHLLNLLKLQLNKNILDRRSIAASIIGIKLKLITKIGVFIDINLDKTTNIAKSRADNIIFFNFDISFPF